MMRLKYHVARNMSSKILKRRVLPMMTPMKRLGPILRLISRLVSVDDDETRLMARRWRLRPAADAFGQIGIFDVLNRE